MSIKGVYLGFFLPANMLAASVARRPSVLPLASTTNHLRVISCELGKYVDIVTCSPREPSFGRGLHTTAKISRPATALPQTKGSESLEWRRLDFTERFQGIAQSASSGSLSWQATWARSIFRSVCCEAASRTYRTSPRRIRRRLQRAGRGTAQEDQSNAIGQGSQRGWGYYMRTKEAFRLIPNTIRSLGI
jgi:hypothetical protein